MEVQARHGIAYNTGLSHTKGCIVPDTSLYRPSHQPSLIVFGGEYRSTRTHVNSYPCQLVPMSTRTHVNSYHKCCNSYHH